MMIDSGIIIMKIWDDDDDDDDGYDNGEDNDYDDDYNGDDDDDDVTNSTSLIAFLVFLIYLHSLQFHERIFHLMMMTLISFDHPQRNSLILTTPIAYP